MADSRTECHLYRLLLKDDSLGAMGLAAGFGFAVGFTVGLTVGFGFGVAVGIRVGVRIGVRVLASWRPWRHHRSGEQQHQGA
jgi:hypothetical protein